MLRLATLLLLLLTLIVASGRSRSQTYILPEWDIRAASNTLAIQSVKSPEPFIWWEAEQPTNTNFPSRDRHPFAPRNATEAAILSNGKWIGVEGQRSTPLFLDYQVTVTQGGNYFFYTRKFWQHGPFRWRWDEQPWHTVGDQIYLMDSAPMRESIEVNWVGLGQVNLARGQHRLRVELTQMDGAAAFDCFALTQSPLQARGKLKPNQRYIAKVPNGFLFDPKPDAMQPSSIDLRYLNESIAGSQGFIRVNGEEFVHEKTGQPIRFWAVNVSEDTLLMDRATMTTMARFLAKQGVNMVRVHTPFWAEDLRTVSPQKLNGLFQLVTELKHQGIYTTLSIYFPVWLKLQEAQGFPGYNGQSPFALLFFNPDFQKVYYGWWKEILTTPNPDTGKTLSEDTALAAVELVNEDSYFFWTFTPNQNIPAAQTRLLEQQFGNWLKTKYGSIATALTAWANPQTIPGDVPTEGRVGFLPLYDIFTHPQSRRAQDTAAFLANSQKTFFETAIAYLRHTLNYKGLIYTSNWITADSRILGPLDKYTNTVGDFMDRHGYVEGLHRGDKASYSLEPGQIYEDRPVPLFKSFKQDQDFDFDLPIMDVRYNGKPSTITEINWAMPNRFRADFPVLAAAYGSLQGTDGFFFFITNSPNWQSTLTKFSIASPVIIGQFPATALMYRQGMIAPGQTVMDVALKVEDLLKLQGAPISAPQNLDIFRSKDIPAGQQLNTDRAQTLDPLSFLVGKVNVQFSDQATAKQTNLADFIDRNAKIIRSNTGQLLWDYNLGLVTINAPKAQGATGFLHRAGTVSLDTLEANLDTDYGSILLVALDDQPLATSQKMLLQVMSEEQNFAWQTSGSPRKTIQSIGNSAIAVRHLSGTLSLKRADAASLKVTALTHNGYPATKLGNAAHIRLQPETFYYLLEKDV